MLVLGYHNIGPNLPPSSWLTIPQRNFYRQMKMLQRVGRFLHPDELSGAFPETRNRFNILITFDDGYQGWYRYAVPVLRELQIPALFFVSTKNLVSGQPYWFEVLVQYFEQGLLEQIDLTDLGLGFFRLSPRGAASRWDEINRLLVAVKNRAHEFAEDDRDDILAIFAAQSRGELKLTDVSQPLTREQCQQLAADPLFSIGSHSHHHRILTNLEDKVVTTELCHSREVLESLCSTAITAVAYPNGNIDQRVAAAAAACGYRFGFGLGRADCRVDPLFRIQRRMIGSFDSPLQFGYRLGKDYLCHLLRNN